MIWYDMDSQYIHNGPDIKDSQEGPTGNDCKDIPAVLVVLVETLCHYGKESYSEYECSQRYGLATNLY